MMRLSSLRARLTAAVTLAFAGWMALVCLVAMVYLFHSARREADRALEATVAALRQAGQPGAPDQAAATAAYLAEHERELAAGHLSAALQPAEGTPAAEGRWLHGDADDWIVRRTPLGMQTLVVGYHWQPVEDELRERVALLAAVSLLVVLGVALAAWTLVGRTLAPIHLLSQQARASSAEALQVRLVSPSRDAELVELVDTLNGLLGRLGETVAARGRFHAAASHELRTPLQALTGHLEVALSRPREGAEYRTALEEARSQARRLVSLVRDLLLLNQFDAAPPPARLEQVSLAEVCERVLGQARPAMAERGLRLVTGLEQDGEVMAPLLQAEMLLRNLIENAVKYAAPGGEVGVWVQEAPGLVTVLVHNTCAPIPDWDAEALFEPFYRLDASRNEKTGGNGLGLAICRAIAVSNGWSVSLSQDAGGVMARVQVPVGPAVQSPGGAGPA